MRNNAIGTMAALGTSLRMYYFIRLACIVLAVLVFSEELHGLAAGVVHVVQSFGDYISMRAAL